MHSSVYDAMDFEYTLATGGSSGVSMSRVARRAVRPIRIDVIGSTARARASLARAEWPPAAGHSVILVAPADTLLVRSDVLRATQLADHGGCVYVVTGPPLAPTIRPWHTVDWVDGPRGTLRLVIGSGGRRPDVSAQAQPRFPSTGINVELESRPATLGLTGATRKPPTRRSVALRLASKGPAAAAYTERYRAAHGRGPTWTEIASDLTWPGDAIDHVRALEALVCAEWVTPSQPPDFTRPGRRWLERMHDSATAPAV